MGRDSKYKGGTKVVPFRLPIVGYKAVRARVQALLDEIAQESQYKSPNAVKSTGASAKTTLSNKAQYEPNESKQYQCGCTHDSTLFRRANGCKIPRSNHLESYTVTPLNHG